MPDPFEIKKPFLPFGRSLQEREAKRRGYTIQRPTGEIAFQGKPTLTSSYPEASKDWASLIKFNSGYRDVFNVMNDPSDPQLFTIARKAQMGKPLTLEDNAVIEQVWRVMAEGMVEQQEEAMSNKWLLSQGWATNPEARAFQISQAGKEPVRDKYGMTSEDRYQSKKQEAEGAFLAKREKEYTKQIQEAEKQRQALKGPREWMRFMVEIGEEPSWLGYWFSRRSTGNA